MKTLKIIGDCCLVFLAVISVCISLAFGYYKFFVKDTTIGVNNINDQLAVDIKKSDELTEEEIDYYEERYFMEANYYSNDKNNGIELQELKYNYFTGVNLAENEYRSTGMQYLGDFSTFIRRGYSIDEANEAVLEEFYYYDTTNDINWSGFKGQYGSVGTRLNRNEELIIKIDNRPFSIKLDGKVETGWWIFGTTTMFDYGDVFDCVFSAIESNDKGYGDYYITLDLSQYFSIKEYDPETKKFKKDDVTDIIKNYAVLKFHYDENGARNSSQSIFGIIECNSRYDLVEEEIDTSYWQENFVYNLNEEHFDYRYSEEYKGYFVSLNAKTRLLLEKMNKIKVNVDINLQSQSLIDKGINVVGIDYFGFENFKIDTCSVIGDSQQFYVLKNGLYNTGLQTLKYSEGIVFEFFENSINSDYLEVVL